MVFFDRYFYNKVVSEADVFISFGIKEDLHDDNKNMMQNAIQSKTVRCSDIYSYVMNARYGKLLQNYLV